MKYTYIHTYIHNGVSLIGHVKQFRYWIYWGDDTE